MADIKTGIEESSSTAESFFVFVFIAICRHLVEAYLIDLLATVAYNKGKLLIVNK